MGGNLGTPGCQRLWTGVGCSHAGFVTSTWHTWRVAMLLEEPNNIKKTWTGLLECYYSSLITWNRHGDIWKALRIDGDVTVVGVLFAAIAFSPLPCRVCGHFTTHSNLPQPTSFHNFFFQLLALSKGLLFASLHSTFQKQKFQNVPGIIYFNKQRFIIKNIELTAFLQL